MMKKNDNYIYVHINNEPMKLYIGRQYMFVTDSGLSMDGRLVQFKSGSALGDMGEELVLQNMFKWFHFRVESIVSISEVIYDNRNRD